MGQDRFSELGNALAEYSKAIQRAEGTEQALQGAEQEIASSGEARRQFEERHAAAQRRFEGARERLRQISSELLQEIEQSS